MTNSKAVAIYRNNVAETRAYFDAKEDILRDQYMNSDMCITVFDARLDAIRKDRAYYINEEIKIYHMNMQEENA